MVRSHLSLPSKEALTKPTRGVSVSLLACFFFCMCGFHPFVVYRVSIDIRAAINYNIFLLVTSIFATSFGRLLHPQTLKYMTGSYVLT